MYPKPIRAERGTRGFTLIEILVVLAIVALLSGIAWPLFRMQLSNSRDSAVKADMNHIAKVMETYYYNNNTYPPAGSDLSADEFGKFTASDGVVTEVHVFPDLATGEIIEYCIVSAHVVNQRIFWYDSKYGEMYDKPGPTPPVGSIACAGVISMDMSDPNAVAGITLTEGTASGI